MFHGINNDRTPPNVMQAMRLSNIDFYLTGSRYFGNSTPDSDWDFFVDQADLMEYDIPKEEALKKLRKFFVANNFQKIHSDNYADCEIIEVWKHESFKIDVQIVKDSHLKNKAQEYIRSNPGFLKWHNGLDKHQRSQLWDLVFAAVTGNTWGSSCKDDPNVFELISGINKPMPVEEVLKAFC